MYDSYWTKTETYEALRTYIEMNYDGLKDMVFIPRTGYKVKPALVVELKRNRTADAAIEQIKEKKYPQSLSGYCGDTLLVGINYDKKTKEHSCVVERGRSVNVPKSYRMR